MAEHDLPEKVGLSTGVESSSASAESPPSGTLINVSGHKQELERNFGLISLCGLGISSGNTWNTLGGTVVRTLHFLVLGPAFNTACRLWRYTMAAPLVLFTSSLQPRSSTGSLRPRLPSLHRQSPHQEEVRK